MIKKAIVSAAVLGIGAVTLLGTDVCSYSKTMFGNVREAVQAEIQPEFKLEDIRNQVDSLMPEIREHMKVVAEQVVDVRNIQAEILEKQSKLQNQKASILALRSDLDSNNSEFEYRQVSYTRNEVESDLSDRFRSFRLLESSVDRDVKIMTATKETLRANQKKLDAMMSRKQNLAVKVSQAEARLKQIQATETVNAIEVDDTQLSHVEELLRSTTTWMSAKLCWKPKAICSDGFLWKKSTSRRLTSSAKSISTSAWSNRTRSVIWHLPVDYE